MTYGLFILTRGEWKLIETFRSLAEAKQEQAYVRECLGLNAHVFQR